MFSIDHLIAEVNEVVKKPSAESLRISAMTNVRHVFGRIGYGLVCPLETFEIEVSKGVYPIPPSVIQIIDVGYQGVWIGATQKEGYDLTHIPKTWPYPEKQTRIVYTKSPLELRFANVTDAIFSAKGYRFPTDENGVIQIPEQAYQACLKYCIYQGLSTSASITNPYWQNRMMFRSEAEEEIIIARGLLNEHTTADYRGIRRLS